MSLDNPASELSPYRRRYASDPEFRASEAQRKLEARLKDPAAFRKRTAKYARDWRAGQSAEKLAARRKYQRDRMTERRLLNPEGVRAYDQAWRDANPERVKESRNAWYHGNPDKVRRMKLKALCGITPGQWDAAFEAQGRRCKICRSEDPRTSRGHWSTDHNHETGEFRGILCAFCNSMLGYALDAPTTLLAAIEYLKGSK